MRIFKVLIFLSMLLGGSLLVLRGFWVEQLAIFVLQKAGAEEISVDVGEFNFRQLVFDDLAAEYGLPGGEKLSVQLSDGALQYSLYHFLTTGRYTRLSIDTITLSRRVATIPKTSIPLCFPKEQINFSDVLPQRLALEELVIKQLLFRDAFPEYLLNTPVRLEVSQNETALLALVEMKAGTLQTTVGGSLLLQCSIPLSLPGKRKFSVKAELSEPYFSGGSAVLAKLQLVGNIEDDCIGFDSGSFFHTENVSFGTMGLNLFSLDLAGKIRQNEQQFVFELSGQQQLQMKGLTAKKSQISDITLRLDSSSFGLAKSAFGVELKAEISIPVAELKKEEQRLALKDVSGVFSLKEKQISGTLQLAPEKASARIGLAFQHDLLHGTGSFTMETEDVFTIDENEMRFSSLLSPWPFPFDLVGGKLSLLVDGSWNVAASAEISANISLSEGRGYYHEYEFDGLELQQDVILLPQSHSRAVGSVAFDHLRAGIDIYGIRAEMNVLPSDCGPLPQVEITDFGATLFDGHIASSNIIYNANQPDSSFTVDLKGLNLEEIVDLVQMDTLFVSGVVSGSIPVSIKGKAISVEAGELYSEEPGGEIRYTPGDMNKSGITGYALKAVEELHYKALGATVMYFPSGQLDFDIALRGNSPALDSSRPVHLNIHAEQNLPALLQSLRVDKGVLGKLDKGVRHHYN